MKLSKFSFLIFVIAICFESQIIYSQELTPNQSTIRYTLQPENIFDLRLIPNPVKHVSALTIDLNKMMVSMNVRIHSLQGQLIKSIQIENIQHFQTKLDIQHGWFPEPGIYVAKIMTPDANKMIRFLVTN